mmetsp:Transcript_16774/g.68604  ORF Transcript_16774/g.68604 Transcript_16774/m.68604 type:complete len:227 (+) Transcript_16774:2153-2833(+)
MCPFFFITAIVLSRCRLLLTSSLFKQLATTLSRSGAVFSSAIYRTESSLASTLPGEFTSNFAFCRSFFRNSSSGSVSLSTLTGSALCFIARRTLSHLLASSSFVSARVRPAGNSSNNSAAVYASFGLIILFLSCSLFAEILTIVAGSKPLMLNCFASFSSDPYRISTNRNSLNQPVQMICSSNCYSWPCIKCPVRAIPLIDMNLFRLSAAPSSLHANPVVETFVRV